jgi:NADPH2:quinone reductase
VKDKFALSQARSLADAPAQYAVHKVYPFTAEGVAQTQIDMSSRGTTGKLLVHVSDSK